MIFNVLNVEIKELEQRPSVPTDTSRQEMQICPYLFLGFAQQAESQGAEHHLFYSSLMRDLRRKNKACVLEVGPQPGHILEL